MIQHLKDEDLYLLPLGGAGEIGSNATLYGYKGKWLLVDLGIKFADDTMQGIEILLPDISFLQAHRDQLLGIVLTHAHEDHFGALPYLWSTLRCPVYGTAFSLELLRLKLQDFAPSHKVPLHEIQESRPLTLGPFSIELLRVTHSIPESHILALRTSHGTVVHTGDWKLDPTPVIGSPTKEDQLISLGQEDVIAMICDSTNALEKGTSGSETDVKQILTRLFGRFSGRIAITCFASNVERIESIALAGLANNRQTALVGRSLWRINEAARTSGYLTKIPEFLNEYAANRLPASEVILICAGSQGEKRSALSRLASGEHPVIELTSGDVVIFSSRIIPGNEKTIYHVQNQLITQGIEVITVEDEPVHVSGHPAQEELTRMYGYICPRVVIPVHGEPRHQAANARLASTSNIPMTLIPVNGMVIRLAPHTPEVVGTIDLQPLAVDGKRLIPYQNEIFRVRKKLGFTGMVMVSLVIKGPSIYQPQVSVLGLLSDEEQDTKLPQIVNEISKALYDLTETELSDDKKVQEVTESIVRKFFKVHQGKKPLIKVHGIRI